MRFNEANEDIQYQDGWKDRLNQNQIERINQAAGGAVGFLNYTFGYRALH